MSQLRRLPAATANAAELRRRSVGAMIAHKRRCRDAGPLEAVDLDRMLRAYHDNGGAITRCPTAYALPVQNGTGA